MKKYFLLLILFLIPISVFAKNNANNLIGLKKELMTKIELEKVVSLDKSVGAIAVQNMKYTNNYIFITQSTYGEGIRENPIIVLDRETKKVVKEWAIKPIFLYNESGGIPMKVYRCNKCKKMYQKNDENKCPYCGTESKGSKKVHYIKRVIGLPGEHIEIKSDYTAKSSSFKVMKFKDEMDVSCGHVYINGEQLTEDYLNEPMIVDNNRYVSVDLVVPEGSYFVMGDNRNNSEDARFWPNQFLTMKDIEAKAYLVYWPFNRIGLIK